MSENKKEDEARPSTSKEGGSESAPVPSEDKPANTSDDSPGKNEDGIYTIDDAVNQAGYGKFQVMLTFLAGMGWLADAFEVIILSIIGDLLACEWTVERWQNALMTSMVFTGMAIGAPFLGAMADRFGRKIILGISMLFLFIFGAASAAAPDLNWIIILRALMGFSLGGIAQGVTLACEYYPAHKRGRSGFYISYFWSLGTIGVIAAAWLIMAETNNWRIFVFVAAIPALLVFLTMKWYPESSRFYLVSGQREKAVKTLERMVKMNKKEMPKGELMRVDGLQKRGRVQDLLKPKIRRASLLFGYIWFAVACSYYGLALITPHIVVDGSLIATRDKQNDAASNYSTTMPCKRYSNHEFLELLWTSAAEFPGILIFSMTVDYCSRKIYLGVACLLNGFLLLFIMLEMKPEVALLCVVFITRGVCAGLFQLLFIMTTEAFPTTLRASAMGSGSGMARLGGLIVPFLAQFTVLVEPIPSMIVLAIVISLAGVASFMLPMETRGKLMQECVEEVKPDSQKDAEA